MPFFERSTEPDKLSKSSKKLKYQYDDSLAVNCKTNNYYWADGMSSTFVACARKAGVENPKAFGSDFAEFYSWSCERSWAVEKAHPSKIRKVIHWYFERSSLRFKLNISTSQEFLKHYFKIFEAMDE